MKFKGGHNQKPVWCKYIEHRIWQQNNNFVAVTLGKTGTGKSWFTLSVAETLDPDFSKKVDSHVCWSPLQVLKLINSGKLKRGDVIVMEELGTQISNRKWFSEFNQAIVQLVQTFRVLGYILLLNVPYLDFIDSQVRRLIHSGWYTCGVDNEKRMGYVRPYLWHWRSGKSEPYHPYLKCKINGKVIKVKRWGMPAPSNDLVEKYEKNKKDFVDGLNLKLQRRLEAAERKAESKYDLTENQKIVYEYFLSGLNGKEIAKKMNISGNAVSAHKRALLKKGYELTKTSHTTREDI